VVTRVYERQKRLLVEAQTESLQKMALRSLLRVTGRVGDLLKELMSKGGGQINLPPMAAESCLYSTRRRYR